ncbi:MAG: hypothetical protein JWN95_1361 [Frankiales bacterium]|nr:hypothetical protein [Frankiales bacterium]
MVVSFLELPMTGPRPTEEWEQAASARCALVIAGRCADAADWHLLAGMLDLDVGAARRGRESLPERVA